MIEREPTIYQLRRARELYDFKDIPNSITHGEKQFIGAIGEVVVCDLYREEFNKDVIFISTKDYDMTIEGYTVDVKTKTTHSRPKEHWTCMIHEESTHQTADYYIFCRYDEEKNILYVVGGISRKKFYMIARYAPKGYMDDIDFTKPLRAGCYYCLISELNPIDEK